MKRTRQTLFEGVLIGCVVALAISILLPTLRRACETAGRPCCPSNLKQTGQAMLLYANAQGASHRTRLRRCYGPKT